MENPKNNEPMLYEKYEALLNGLIPTDYKDHILHDKLSLLTKQNSLLENSLLTLRHELSNLIAKHYRHLTTPKPAKYTLISSALKHSLEISDFEVSQFAEIHSKALESVKSSNEGFINLISNMKSKLFPPNKKNLEFMSSVLCQVQEIRSQLASIYGYVTILEYNEKVLRESLNCKDDFALKNRSQSVSRVDQFEQIEKVVSKKYAKTLLVEVPSTNNSIKSKSEELQGKVNVLKIALGKMRNQRDLIEIDNQKMLMQLKQAKEQLALCEENSAAKEVMFKNKIEKLTRVVNYLKGQSY